MGATSEPTKYKFSCKSSTELLNLIKFYPVSGWDFNVWEYGTLDISTISLICPNLHRLILSLRKTLITDGCAIIEFADLLNSFSEPISASAITLLLSILGSPLRVFASLPHWRQIGVDLNRPPDKSGGSGSSPLHMDFVNAEPPPDIVCLLCIRPDPFGGGASLISRISGIEDLLDSSDLLTLSQSQFKDGQVKNLIGVGKDINPFPVISSRFLWKYRFTGNLFHSAMSNEANSAILRMSNILDSKTMTFILNQGDLLLINQHLVVHGRGAMGKGQERLAESERRFLLHSFIRQN